MEASDTSYSFSSLMQVSIPESFAGKISRSHSEGPNVASCKIKNTKESGRGESEGLRGRTRPAVTLEGKRKCQIAAGK